MERWPGIWKAFEHACAEWFEPRMREGLRAGRQHDNFPDYYAAYLNGFEGQKKPLLEQGPNLPTIGSEMRT
jgi:hypothetical protein